MQPCHHVVTVELFCGMQIEPRLAGDSERETTHKESLHYFREATSRPFLAAGGFKRESAIKAIADGKADAVVFGEYSPEWF